MTISFTATRRPREIFTTLLPSTGPMARIPSGRERSKGMVSPLPSSYVTVTEPSRMASGPSGETIRISSISTGSARETASSKGMPERVTVWPLFRNRSSRMPEDRLAPSPRRISSTGGARWFVSRTSGRPSAFRFRLTMARSYTSTTPSPFRS